MRDHSSHIEMTRDDAVRAMLSRCGLEDKRRTEEVPVASSSGRVLARDHYALCDIPTRRTCNMDSIAVRWCDFADLPAGKLPDTASWVRGVHWEFANTGVAMPHGFDTAIVIEHVVVAEDEQSVSIDAAPSCQYAGTREAGSQMKRGQLIGRAGDVVTPELASRLATGGNGAVSVVRPPRVVFIPTGNELVPTGMPFNPQHPDSFAALGKTFEANGALVRGKVESWGGELSAFDIVPDCPDAIEDAILRACDQADIVVINAGSSKGSDDWTCEVLEKVGDVVFHQTSHGPGRHTSFAMVNNVPVLGISGPPAGAALTVGLYLKPLIQAFLGLDPAPRRVTARLVEAFSAGGPGGHGKPASTKAATVHGEDRPRETGGPGKGFCTLRGVSLSVGDDGVLEARPAQGGNAPDAVYLMPVGPGIKAAQTGEMIRVELA